MYRIRLHGRGGQGMKTAGRILGTAFFNAGYEVQDAPRYGAERRGAPIFSYVRADKKPIDERGIITNPDLIIVADESLVKMPAADVTLGLNEQAVLLINSHETAQTWQKRLGTQARIIVLPVKSSLQNRAELPFISAACVGAAARLLGVISKSALVNAVQEELHDQASGIIKTNCSKALEAFEYMAAQAGCVQQRPESSAMEYQQPEWIVPGFEKARVSAPAIHAGLTSIEVKTGLWRTLCPIIDYDRCNQCWWICSSACPHNAINVDDNTPVIDYDHCVGCMVCVAQCPSHVIKAVPETESEKEIKQSTMQQLKHKTAGTA